jgi:AcrR family transcriptional regulator
VSKRSYRSADRQAAAAETRARIVAAARELLDGREAIAGFSVDAVARRAGVARVTVYYQFTSKRGLLEAVMDQLAHKGLVDGVKSAYQQTDPLATLAGLVAAFGEFWASDRDVIRRLRKLTALDPEFDQAIIERDERRREHMRRAILLVRKAHGRPPPGEVEELVNVLHTLTSFETFDTLAGPDRRPGDVTPTIQKLARAALGFAP